MVGRMVSPARLTIGNFLIFRLCFFFRNCFPFEEFGFPGPAVRKLICFCLRGFFLFLRASGSMIFSSLGRMNADGVVIGCLLWWRGWRSVLVGLKMRKYYDKLEEQKSQVWRGGRVDRNQLFDFGGKFSGASLRSVKNFPGFRRGGETRRRSCPSEAGPPSAEKLYKQNGGVREWLKRTVLKTVIPVKVS